MKTKRNFDDDLEPVIKDLWDRVRQEERGEELPFPCGLTDSEEELLFLMRTRVAGENGSVAESEIQELFLLAGQTKALWYIYRAAMRGLMDVTIQNGEPMVKLSERFVRENQHLAETIKKYPAYEEFIRSNRD